MSLLLSDPPENVILIPLQEVLGAAAEGARLVESSPIMHDAQDSIHSTE